jgi:stage V sporulation protein B
MSERPAPGAFSARVVAGRRDEGRRALRNFLSFGGFVFAPLSVRWTSAALGGDGYGRWWWTFGLLEAGGMLGMLGADLFIRREVPRLVEEGDEEALYQTVGSGVFVLVAAGVLLAMLQCLLVPSLTRAQGDAELAPYLLILSAQPILWNLGNALGCTLQSMNVLAALALLRGIFLPALQIGLLYACARGRLGVVPALVAMIAVSLVGVVLTMAIYARHLSLRRTFACALRPRLLRPLLGFGAPLLLPALLWTVGAKLDLYVLGAQLTPERVGVYAACLQLASLVPALRGALDPVAQTEIGALHHTRRLELADSLRRMARLAAIGAGLPLAILLALGAPVLSRLLHRPVPETALPLIVLAVGQFVGAIAIGSWLLPMTYPSRMTALVAGTTLAVKLGLLVVLVPRLGLVGAAIATTTGTIIAQQGQALWAARALERPPYPASLLVVLLVTLVAAAVGRGALRLAGGLGDDLALGGALILTSLVFAVVMLALLEREERVALRAFLGLGERRDATGDRG